MVGRFEDDDAARDSLVRLHLSEPLPCGMGTCRRPAYEALAEPDPAYPGAWVLLPICPACDAQARVRARRIVRGK